MKTLTPIVLLTAAVALVALAAEAPKTYKPDGEGFVRNWLLLDPIALNDDAANHEEGSQKQFFEKEYLPGQKELKPKAGDKAKVADKELQWRAVEAGDYAVDFEKFANDNGKEPGKALFLGVAYITCEEDLADVKLAIGSECNCDVPVGRRV